MWKNVRDGKKKKNLTILSMYYFKLLYFRTDHLKTRPSGVGINPCSAKSKLQQQQKCIHTPTFIWPVI